MIRKFFCALVWVLLRFIYRVRVRGSFNIPETGPAILTPNHVSFIDAVLIASHTRRPIRFAMYWKLYRPFAFILAPLGAFPIASKSENPVIYQDAFFTMADTLNDGGLLCIFPEGMITLDGEVGEFKGGVRKLLDAVPVPVIPVGLQNLWGSYFSKKKPGLLKLPDHFMAKITMLVGEPLHSTTPLEEIRQRVIDLTLIR